MLHLDVSKCNKGFTQMILQELLLKEVHLTKMELLQGAKEDQLACFQMKWIEKISKILKSLKQKKQLY